MAKTPRSKVLLGLTAATILLSASTAQAAGYAILEQSSEGLGVAFAGATAGYGDGSEVFFNPSAMTSIPKFNASASVTGIMPRAKFKNDGSTITGTPIPLSGGDGKTDEGGLVPSAYTVYPMDDLAFGFGVNSPFGLASKYGRDWVGRYTATKSELKTVNLNPAVAYKLLKFSSDSDLSVGAGLNVYYLEADLQNQIDFGTIGYGALGPQKAAALGLTPQGNDGSGKVTGSDWATGWTVGSTYTYSKGSRIGISYRSQVAANLNGDATFQVPTAAKVLQSSGLFTDTGASAGVTLPESLNIGWTHQLTEDWSLMGEAQGTRWSRFNELRVQYDSVQPDTVTTENWKNAWRFSSGTKYKLCNGLTLKGGLGHDSSPIRNGSYRTPRIPDADRFWLSSGLSYQITEGVTGDLSYAHIFVKDASTNISSPTAGTLNGNWDSAIDIVALGVTAAF